MMNLHIYKKIILFILFSVSAAAFCQGEIEINNARVNVAPPGIEVTAGYLEIYNSGNEPAVLTKISSPEFRSIEMHKSIIKDGIARMLKQDSITIPSGSSMSFKPGDYHLMLFGPVKPLKAGDTVILNLVFSGDAAISITAEVSRPGVEHEQHH